MKNNAPKVPEFTKGHWSEDEQQAANLALSFVQNLMNDHNLELIGKQYATTRYTQHNRNMADGINGVLNYIGTLTKRFPDFSYEVKTVTVDGDMVTLHSHATMNKKHRGNDRKGFNIIDTWRVEGGQLVEHWDSVQPLDSFMRLYYWLTGGSVQNTNGVF